MLTIAVTAAGGGVGGAVLRALKLSKLKFTRIITFDMSPILSGLHLCDKSYIVPPADNQKYKKIILKLCKQEKIDILIVGSDPELVPISEIAEQLQQLGCFPICSDLDINKISRDKKTCADLLIKQGFPFVRTVKIKDIDSLIDSTGFPIVIKPKNGSASKGVVVAFKKDDTKDYLDNDAYIAQEYILSKEWGKNKEELIKSEVYAKDTLIQKDEISIQILLDNKGQVLGTFTSRNQLKDGVPVFVKPIENDDSGATKIALKMAEYLTSLGLRGPCNFQCKLTEEGPMFYEINPRFTGITAVRAAMGFNEVEACIKSFVLKEQSINIAACLHTNYNFVCSRYITEYIFPSDDYNNLATLGEFNGKGWSIYL